ncbi:DUF6098 family protein [Streptomyces sp. TRM 70361]|uniref:DUF6098 family protein n=1 Tax=Streptomyces sp. TRM 70361 TaxID=3116553 RepID=UPI002E7AF47C|nr:DUF6098 family protein [Streptomyces sp. TRM 70361]MEE1941239.1 DUF6098 family protein [Streptomyces sp. TRM 70361]
MTVPPGLPHCSSLDELARMVEHGGRLYVRWSRGPRADLGRDAVSTDDLTGVPLPGLSANALEVEPWWGERPVRLWVARRLYDYCHLRRVKAPGIRPWVLRGREVGRGPDNEPLVREVEPVAWVAPGVITEAEEEVNRQHGDWGPLDRGALGGTRS